jgi:hypothetical protein
VGSGDEGRPDQPARGETLGGADFVEGDDCQEVWDGRIRIFAAVAGSGALDEQDGQRPWAAERVPRCLRSADGVG